MIGVFDIDVCCCFDFCVGDVDVEIGQVYVVDCCLIGIKIFGQCLLQCVDWVQIVVFGVDVFVD